MEEAPAVIVRAETRDICEKCRYRALRETRFRTHHLKKSSNKIYALLSYGNMPV